MQRGVKKKYNQKGRSSLQNQERSFFEKQRSLDEKYRDYQKERRTGALTRNDAMRNEEGNKGV